MRTSITIPSEAKLCTVDGIDMKSTGQTSLYTVPVGKSCIITKAILRVTSASGGTIGATVTIGVNAGSFSDFISTTVTGLLTAGQYGVLSGLLSTTAGSKVYSAGDVIKFNVATGATATTLTTSVDLFGYLI